MDICINTDKTFAVVRCNKVAPSKAMLDWAVAYLQERGFTKVEQNESSN